MLRAPAGPLLARGVLPMAPRQSYFQTPSHVVAAGVIMPAIDVLAVSARLYARRRQKQRLRLDDWLMFPALIFAVGTGVILVYGVYHGALGGPVRIPDDFHGSQLELVTDQVITMNTLQWSFGLMIPLALGCAKASFLYSYIRVFSVGKHSWTYRMLVSALSFVIIWTATFFLAVLFQCRLKFWANYGSFLDLATHCPDSMKIDISICASDFVTDVIIFIIPIPLIWRLSMSRAKKLAVCGVFFLGGITIVASLLRFIMMARIYLVGYDPDEDGGLVVTGYMYWGSVECSVAVFAACLPSILFLFKIYFWPTIKSSVGSFIGSRTAEKAEDQSPITRITPNRRAESIKSSLSEEEGMSSTMSSPVESTTFLALEKLYGRESAPIATI